MSSKHTYASALSPEYPLLGLLIQQPAHGYRLHQRLTTDLGQIWRISLSQAYNILKRMETYGFIIGQMQEQVGTPARRHFEATPKGVERFEEWLDTPSGSSVRAIRVEFITRLYFALTKNKKAASHLIDEQVAESHKRLEILKGALDLLPLDQVFNRLALELRIHQLESILDWLPQCSTMIGL
ncbi:MAG: helix-turn-helix transcriptional regulator [Anaerolineales bacterium]|nr:helix-turn-helix transcriptional regulator [Anaerolineales bacterium]